MTKQEQADQLRLAAGILETGHPWEYRTRKDSEWASSSAISPTYVFTYQQGEIRIILATPPDGRPLHNPDNLTADQVGVGKRLTLVAEPLHLEAEIWQRLTETWSPRDRIFSGEAYSEGGTYRLPLSVPWPALPEPEFQLPTPPPGIEWHRKDGWNADDLPQGYRPLVYLEHSTNQTQAFFSGTWIRLSDSVIAGAEENPMRTTRLLTFTHLGKTWTWHKAGDPCPCDGERWVHILCKDLSTPGAAKAAARTWDTSVTSDSQIIGWRYAEPEPATKTVPLGPEDCPPNSVFRSPEWKPSIYITPSLVAQNGVTCASVEYLSFAMLKDAGWQINRPANRDANGNPTAWEPCSKQIPA